MSYNAISVQLPTGTELSNNDELVDGLLEGGWKGGRVAHHCIEVGCSSSMIVSHTQVI